MPNGRGGFKKAKLKHAFAHPLTFAQLNCNGLLEHPRHCRHGLNGRYDFENLKDDNKQPRKITDDSLCACANVEALRGSCPKPSELERAIERLCEHVLKEQYHLVYLSECWIYGEDKEGTKPLEGHMIKDWFERFRVTRKYRTYYALQHRHWNSKDTAWNGNVVLVHKDVQEPVHLRRHQESLKLSNHNSNQGRVLELEFPDGFFVLCTYVPFSGFNNRFSRNTRKINLRKTFDKAVRTRLEVLKSKNKKVVWCGDLNCSPEALDHFMGDPAYFAEYTNSMSTKDKEDYIENVDDRGYWGYTTNERTRFKETITSFNGVDAFRHLHPFDRKYTQSSGTRWDHFIISKELVPRLKACQIFPEKKFLSDHCLVTMKLSLEKIETTTTTTTTMAAVEGMSMLDVLRSKK